MDIISAEEWPRLSFLEVEPTPTDKDVAWPYNDYLYEIIHGEFELSCSIAPAYRDVGIILTHKGAKLYELNSMGVKDVRYRNEGNVESLEIVLSNRESIQLVVKPVISINHEMQKT
jgi:hypothetical protein